VDIVLLFVMYVLLSVVIHPSWLPNPIKVIIIIWSEKERCSSKMKPRLRAECVVLRGQFCILASCFFESDEKKFGFRGVES